MSTFEPKRFAQFLRFELLTRRTDQLLPLVVPPGIFLLGAMFRLLTGGTTTDWPTISFQAALLLAVTAAAHAHRPEMDGGTAPLYMLLPVAHGERFLSRWALSFALPFVGQLALLTALANLAAGIGWAMGRGFAGPILPDTSYTGRLFAIFLSVHSVFFAGGVFWRSSPLIKTAASVIAYGFALLVAIGIIVGAAYATGAVQSTSMSWQLDGEATAKAFDSMGRIGMIAWHVLLPGLLYGAAFCRARENEVRA